MDKILIPGNKSFFIYSFIFLILSISVVIGTWKAKNTAFYKTYEKKLLCYEEKLEKENLNEINGNFLKVE